MEEKERIRLAVKKVNEWFLIIAIIVALLFCGCADTDRGMDLVEFMIIPIAISLRLWWVLADPDERRNN